MSNRPENSFFGLFFIKQHIVPGKIAKGRSGHKKSMLNLINSLGIPAGYGDPIFQIDHYGSL
jgi:hypothetical protein